MANGNGERSGIQKLHEQSKQPASIRMVALIVTIIMAGGGIVTWALTAQANIQQTAKTVAGECVDAHINSANPHTVIDKELARHDMRLDAAEKDIDALEKGVIGRQAQLDRMEEIMTEVRESVKNLEHGP